MSLLNDVMRDLQTRGVLGVPPLAGLQPVSGVPGQQRKRSHLLPALVALSAVTVVLIWQPVGDSRWLPFARVSGVAPAEIEPLQAITEDIAQAEPAVPATGDDLRELFPIDGVASEQQVLTAEIEVVHVTDTSSEPVAVIEEPVTAAVTAIAKPAVQAQPEAVPTVVESRVVTETPAVTPTPAPAATQASAKPTITRRESGEMDVDSIVARAMQSMRSNDLATAERLLREALAIDSGNAETWSFLYGVLISAARPAAAEQALQQGLGSADQPAPLAKLYARTLLDRGDRDGAVSVLAAHRPAPAFDTEYDEFFAALLQQTGQYAEAGEIYQKLLTIDPDSGAWLVGLAMSHDSLGFNEEALIAFERALTSGSLKSPLDRYAKRRAVELKAYE
jgi:Tfp pilus assembly protein PilF